MLAEYWVFAIAIFLLIFGIWSADNSGTSQNFRKMSNFRGGVKNYLWRKPAYFFRDFSYIFELRLVFSTNIFSDWISAANYNDYLLTKMII